MKKFLFKIVIFVFFGLLISGCNRKIDIDSLPKLSLDNSVSFSINDNEFNQLEILDIQFTENDKYSLGNFSIKEYKKILDVKKKDKSDVEFVFIIKLKNMSDKKIDVRKYFDAKLIHNETFYNLNGYDIINVKDLYIPPNWTGVVKLQIKAPFDVWADIKNVKKYIKIGKEEFNLQIDFIDLGLSVALRRAIEQLVFNVEDIFAEFNLQIENNKINLENINLSVDGFKNFLNKINASFESLKAIQELLMDNEVYLDKGYKSKVLPLINDLLSSYQNIENNSNIVTNFYKNIQNIITCGKMFLNIKKILQGM